MTNITMLAAMLHEQLACYAHPGGPGASAAVVQGGRILASCACGLADVERRAPATLRTNYRLASLSKAFTAMAVMLLADMGQLDFDDRAGQFLPAFPACGREIRIRHLLNHTSGLWDYEDFVPADQPQQVHDRDVPALLADHDQLYFPSGSAYRYSNSGYVILALIVEAVSGTSFARFLHEHIFAPLGMRATVAHEAGISMVPERAWGYTATPRGVQRTDQSPTSATLGDGGIYSSVADLAAWTHALATHELVRPATWQAAVMPPLLADGRRGPYGFGWFVEHDGAGMWLWHHGETMGFTNGIAFDPARDLAVIVLTNRTGGAPWQIAGRVLRMVRAAPHLLM
jgi:CubicO group peptidase (beta-lactamase class C family)